MKSNLYYDNGKLLSYRKFLNFIIGHRGVGKTFDFKCYCLKQFIKKGSKTIWVRRYKSETKEVATKFLDDIYKIDAFKDIKLSCTNKGVYVNGKLAIEFLTLSVSSKYKSVPYPDVNIIVFDEFIIDKSTFKYISGYDEPTIFLDLVNTIFRKRDNGSVYCIANAISFSNPYFMYFNIHQSNKEFTVLPQICVQHYKNQKYIDSVYQTRFGKLIKNTVYGKYAVENEYIKDNNDFIENKTKNARFDFAIKYNSQTYGFWTDFDVGLIFMCDKYNMVSNRVFCLKSKEQGINLILIRQLKNNYTATLKNAFSYGKVRFQNIFMKNIFYEILTLI